jgi:AcrR family transcriptional regulator
MTDARDPIQELLVTARRNQILDAATQVFAEKGFHRATIKDIARTAGIADGTIYTYFASKTGLLLGILNRLNETEQREQQLTPRSEGDFRSFFVTYLRHRMSLLWPNAEVFRAVLPEILVNAELRSLYYQQVIAPTIVLAEKYFQAQIEQGHLRQIDVPLSVRAIPGSILGLLLMQLLGDQEIASRWQELPEVLTTLIFDGLRPDEVTSQGQ